jgi:hypothetical protein
MVPPWTPSFAVAIRSGASGLPPGEARLRPRHEGSASNDLFGNALSPEATHES